ncbi:hypothetical protein VNO78_12570 [Psophocarpus tetragonolobus]|uniref:Uncharacterized protein n=1 Tax=Psophocarpus tetragonolobus TaxID=3891 RepID=A0AAN9SN83_PSOTE
MFEQATIHFGSTELLGEYFSSSRKNYRPSPLCMHREPYQKKFTLFSGCGWPPSIFLKGESTRVQAFVASEYL